LKLRKVS